MLTSSTAPEADYAAWVAATNYTVGTKVIRTTTHRIYENLVAGVDATLPELATGGSTPRWLDIAPTNRWAMFDDEIGSSTGIASPLSVVIKPGPLSAVALLELVGTAVTVTLKDSAGGAVVYARSVTDLDGAVLTDIFDWFVVPFEQISILTFTDLPDSYTDGELTISVTGTGTVSCGVCKFGAAYEIGGTEYGAQLGIIDYSRKETNAFGRTAIVPRRYARTLNAKLMFDQAALSGVYKLLSDLRTAPSVWIGSDAAGFDSLTLYGFYKDFSIDVAYPSASYCSLTIEGLT
jgi:hypothetical protein